VFGEALMSSEMVIVVLENADVIGGQWRIIVYEFLVSVVIVEEESKLLACVRMLVKVISDGALIYI
jgi:hypothetical protein